MEFFFPYQLPSCAADLRIYWHLAGEEGEKQILEMPPSSYVVAMGYAEPLGPGKDEVWMASRLVLKQGISGE